MMEAFYVTSRNCIAGVLWKLWGTIEGDEGCKKAKSSKTYVNILKSKWVQAQQIVTKLLWPLHDMVE